MPAGTPNSVELCRLENGGAVITVVIERKKISSCRLKVFPAENGSRVKQPGQVKFSVPLETSSDWISRYLQSKKEWIIQKLENFKKTNGYGATGAIGHGMSIRMLGQDMLFSIHKTENPLVYASYRSIHINTPAPDSPQILIQLFETWWRKQACSLYGEILDSLYPVIGKHGVKKPAFCIRKMQTLWGSSSPHRGAITLNFYLLKARRPCIEYVVLHELTHFLYPNHNKEFYNFLTLYMPDWRNRKEILDNDVVRGL
jgi:predicted metal-dependent hydrolase